MPRDETERRRGFDADGATAEERARNRSLFFGDLLRGFRVARLCLHALDLPELKPFTAENAR